METTLINREHGVVANLCIPDRFIQFVTLYHSFHLKTRSHSSTCGLDLIRTHIFTTNHYKSEHPRNFYPLYSVTKILRKICAITFTESYGESHQGCP